MSIDKAFEINLQSSEGKETSEELEGLQRDMVELKQVLGPIKMFSVKKVTLSEINLISVKIDSLKDLTAVNTDSVMQLSDAVAGRKKASYTLQNKPCQLSVINNCYDLISLDERCGRETNRLN
jgi:hypothetical protein